MELKTNQTIHSGLVKTALFFSFGIFLFVLSINISIAQHIHSASCIPVVKTTGSPHTALRSVNLTDVTWTEGFWKDRVDMIREITIPHLYEVMNMEDQGKSVHNLMVAAGMKTGQYKGNNWQDSWIYKWIEMAAVSYAVTKEPGLDKKMDELIEMIAKAQEDDGYISTNIQVRKAKRFQAPNDHEWYNMGHLLTAAAIHHRATQKTSLLEVANKVCDYGYYMFGERNKEMAHFPINPSIIMGAVEMYRETGNPKHLELAKMVVDIRGKYPGGVDTWQDRVPLRQETEVMGHAVWYSYLYAGAADVFMETGDSTLLTALNRLWHDLVENKMYVHGGSCAIYRGIGIRKDGNIWRGDVVWEAVGMPFQQPNAYGYNETCGQIGNYKWNYRMLNITGEPRFAEIMENEMYNGFLGSMGQNGKSFFYVNPLRWHGEEQILLSSSELERGVPGSPNIGICCPTNFSRTLVELQGKFYSKSKNAFWIHHYGANRYNDGTIILEQKTRFPWEGNIDITVEKFPQDHSLQIRIPEWAKGTKVSVNGRKLTGVNESSYLDITGLKNGSIIKIEFLMNVRLITGNPKIEETLNQVAVKRGPVLYTMEEMDLPQGVKFNEVVLPADIKFKPVFKPELMNGVMVLEGPARYFKQQNWDKRMYQDFRKAEFKKFKLNLIPYYTWANRGVTKMTVWMPVDY